jgi:hypothetical protein
MTTVSDTAIIDLLRQRDGIVTYVRMKNGNTYTVFNIAWGYDMGDEHAHVTTNISPSLPEAAVDFFVTKDIQVILDENKNVLLSPAE